jgi:glucokinase
MDRLIEAAAIEKRSVGGVGVGAPGWVDHSGGIVRELTNIPGWKDFPLAEHLRRASALKSFIDNHANVMALGELVHGAGRGYRNLICLTLGTGVGGAIVIDGEIHRGTDGLAGEVGHMTLDLKGPQCACGARGCLEGYVGNRAIVARARKILEQRNAQPGCCILLAMTDNRPERITPKLLAAAAEAGDEIAIEVWRETGKILGTALAVLVNLLNPECFIIGGGVARAGAILFDHIRSTLESLAMNQLGGTTPTLEAKLGEDAGIIGAATFAMRCAKAI